MILCGLLIVPYNPFSDLCVRVYTCPTCCKVFAQKEAKSKAKHAEHVKKPADDKPKRPLSGWMLFFKGV